MTVEQRHEPIHSKFGGSIARRIISCPASVELVQKVPANLRKASSYASRGVALHVAMARLLEDDRLHVESLIGQTFNDYMITSEDAENALRPALAFVDALLDTPEAEFYLERRVTFPTVAGAFGTVDLLVRSNSTIHVVDFKFGSGVLVRALAPADDDPAVDVVNSQLMFYAAAARHSMPEFFDKIEEIVITIVQPMSIEPDAEMVSSVTVTHAELDEFVLAFGRACAEAISETPRLQAGTWCRFCPARPICPEHTKPLLDLTQFTVLGEGALPKEAYLQVLADGLNLIDAVKDIRTALHDQAKRALQNGDVVPGYTLSAGRAERHWRNEIAAQVALLSLGFDHDDIIEAETMRSPKQLELRAKARGLKIPDDLIGSRRSGVSLVRSENVRVPILGRDELARTFSEALAAFIKGGRQE
jgi:hypothetical protein